MRRVYLDHSATTPVRPEVAELVCKYMTVHFGNASSVYSFGREARKAVENAREQVAAVIGADPAEIIFTSGGTEADNLAIMGVAYANEKKGNHIITTQIEHHAVLDTCHYLEKKGFEVTYLPVDEHGLVSIRDLENSITDKTVLISVMHANNEVGTIQPVADIGRIARGRGVYFHTDAVQTFGKIPVNVKDMNIDLLAVSAHKIYGPKGTGCLYIRKGTKMNNIMFGGGQERKRRPGTENVPGIVGFGQAAEMAAAEMDQQMTYLAKQRDRLIAGIFKSIDHVKLNGHPEKRLPGNVNVSFRFVEGESLLLSLDMKGIAASSGSACTSGSLDPSHVLLAMGIPHEIAHGSLRMTLGRGNTEEDIDYVLEVLPEILNRLRAMSPLYHQEKESKECCQSVH